MSRTPKALVTPEVLVWARKSAGYDLDAAAKKTGQAAERLADWEAGRAQPTIAQLRKLCDVYRRPLAVFYLPEPPRDFSPVPDFRRLPLEVPKEYSPDLLFAIRQCILRQEWARDLLLQEGEGELPFVGAASLNEDVPALAARIRDALGVTPDVASGWRSAEEALTHWTQRVEDIGIFVAQFERIDPVESRGFALPDPIAPLICINPRDSRPARIFTILHETVHIWLNARGVSNLEPIPRVTSQADRMEVFCNAVAAEIAAPMAEVRTRWAARAKDATLEAQIDQIARRFRVSREVIARRLLDMRQIDAQTYRDLRAAYQAQWRQHRRRQEQAEGGPPHARVVAARNGHAFTRLVVQAYRRGSASASEVSALLNVKVKHIPDVAAAAGLTDVRDLAIPCFLG